MIRSIHRWAAGLAMLTLAYAAPVEAQKITYGGVGQQRGVTYSRLVPGVFAKPGDLGIAFTAWWGLRAYSSAQCSGTTQAVRLRRASDNAEGNILITTSCALDTAAAAFFCNATTCFVHTLYDQVAGNACGGATCNLVQATTATQLTFSFDCVGAKPCVTSGTASITIASANNFTPATGITSLYYVGGRMVGTAATIMVNSNGNLNRLNGSTANLWVAAGGTSGTISRAAIDGAIHAGIAVINGASSILNIDGGPTSGTMVGSTTAGAPSFGRGSTSTTTSSVEGGFIDNVALTNAQRQTLIGASRGYWGF